jgi:hypothetical protein
MERGGGGGPGLVLGLTRAGGSERRQYTLEIEMQPVSNNTPARAGVVAFTEFKRHLGNPG